MTYPEDVMKAARESAEANVENMCLTYRHDFGLMEEHEKAGLRLTMSQIARHEVAPAIARAIMAERERCAKVAKSWWRDEHDDESASGPISAHDAILDLIDKEPI